MTKLLTITALLAGMAFTSAEASAAGGTNPFCNNCPGGGHTFGSFFFKQPLPAFQAAPWYNYWPYDAHFQTPAPLQGAYYAPPGAGGGGQLVNPYFGGGMYGPQAGYPSTMPGYYPSASPYTPAK